MKDFKVILNRTRLIPSGWLIANSVLVSNLLNFYWIVPMMDLGVNCVLTVTWCRETCVIHCIRSVMN